MELTRDNIETIVTIISVCVAIYASFIAKKSLSENKRITKTEGNINMLNESMLLLKENPELLDLHNIKKSELDDIQISAIEFIYIMSSFNAAYYYYLIDGNNFININNFSVYRKNFLNNEKVFLTWKNIIKPKMSNEGTFVKSIDTFYKDKKNDYC